MDFALAWRTNGHLPFRRSMHRTYPRLSHRRPTLRLPAAPVHPRPILLRGDLATWGLWGLGLVLLAILLGRGVFAAPRQAGGAGSGGGLWISDSSIDNGRRLILIVDQELRTMAVYHVEGASGDVTLKSSRDISWDLMVGDFNARPPKPADLKRMLEASQASPPAR